jgi:adenylate kinase
MMTTDGLRLGKAAQERAAWALLGARWLVGGTFLYSGWAKVVEPVEFLKLLRVYDLTAEPLVLNLVAAGLPWFEVFCGLLLVLGVGVRGTALVLLCLLIPFTALIWNRALQIQADSSLAFCAIRFDCGCGTGEVAICRKLLENGLLMGLGVCLVIGRHSRWALSHQLPSRAQGRAGREIASGRPARLGILRPMTVKRSAVILLGPPASGKTTVANAVDANHGVAIIRTGHLLRSAGKADTDSGRELRRHLEAGRLAPTELVVDVIGDQIDGLKADLLIFDGFPRLEDQIAPLFGMLEEKGLQLAAVLVLTLSDQEIHQRLAGRRACPRCGATYHVEAQPPRQQDRCDHCDTALIQRADDAPKAVAERLDSYRQETLPVVHFFQSRHSHLTREVSVEASTDDACGALRAIVQQVGHAV